MNRCTQEPASWQPHENYWISRS